MFQWQDLTDMIRSIPQGSEELVSITHPRQGHEEVVTAKKYLVDKSLLEPTEQTRLS